MLILRSEVDGTRVRAIDELVARGARGPSGRPVIFIDDPALAEIVLHGPTFDRGRLARSFCGNGLLFSDGDHWRERRRIVQPAFPPRDPDQHLQDVNWAMPGLIRRFEAAARAGSTLGVVEETVRFTTRVLYRGVFGQELPEDHDRVEVILDYFDSIGGILSATIFPALKLDGRSMTEVRGKAAAMDVEVDRLIDVRRAGKTNPDDVRTDALGRIIDEVGKAGNQAGVREEVRSLLVAGAETTSNTLGFLLLMLATRPDARDRLERELDAAPGGSPPFLDAVIFETLRLFPAVWFQTRESTTPIELGNHQLEKDDLVFVSTALIHRRPDIWADPDSFRPERFLPGSEDPQRSRHRYAFFPFGGGRHLCLGRHLALHELRLAVRGIFERFRVEVVDEIPLVAELGVVLKPDRRIRVRVTEREKASI
ncbi:MAG: cytochrome P450 [Phycisphaera sp. TMED9]|nr:MAG: cytochrome P450 [Phycisphaera sp. TMED9]